MIRDLVLSRRHRARPPLLARLFAMAALARQRRRLVELDEAALRDLGISRADALAEARRRPWDAPKHWRS